MVFETLLWIGLKVIVKTELSSFSLASLGPTIGKSHVVFHKVLGTLLFIVYVNDLPAVSSLTHSLQFADDTSIFCSHKDPSQLISIVTKEVTKISIWLKTNELSLNLAKTNFMFSRPRQKKINVNFPLVLENIVIKQVTETKFLWVRIDHHLSWKPHISLVSKKISNSIGIIAKARFRLSAKTLLSLYYSLVCPCLSYCSVAWSSTYCSNRNCIYLLQKRIVRLIAKADCLANTAPLFSQLRLLDNFSIISFSIAIFMYSYHRNLLPVTFQCFFMTGEQFHQYNTRTAFQYRSRFCITNN